MMDNILVESLLGDILNIEKENKWKLMNKNKKRIATLADNEKILRP